MSKDRPAAAGIVPARRPDYHGGVKSTARKAGAWLAAVLLSTACVRFTPAALDPPSWFLERCFICPRIDVSADEAEPYAEQGNFRGGEPLAVFCFLELGGLRGRHIVQWRWYAPSGALMRRSGELGVGDAGPEPVRCRTWDELRLESGGERGLWTAAVFLDGLLLAVREFRVL